MKNKKNFFGKNFRAKIFVQKIRENNFSFNEIYFTKKFTQIFCVKTTKEYYREKFFMKNSAKTAFSEIFCRDQQLYILRI
jgi:hypothetical protein